MNQTAIIVEYWLLKKCFKLNVGAVKFVRKTKVVVIIIWKGIHSRSDTNRTGAEILSFYYHRLLNCLDQMLAVMLLSQYQLSSSKTVRPCASCGAQCIEHVVRTWSVVYSEAPHSNSMKERDPICA